MSINAYVVVDKGAIVLCINYTVAAAIDENHRKVQKSSVLHSQVMLGWKYQSVTLTYWKGELHVLWRYLPYGLGYYDTTKMLRIKRKLFLGW